MGDETFTKSQIKKVSVRKLSKRGRNSLVGAGIGVELSFTRRYSVRVDWGFALRDIHDGSGATTVESGDNELQFIFTAIY